MQLERTVHNSTPVLIFPEPGSPRSGGSASLLLGNKSPSDTKLLLPPKASGKIRTSAHRRNGRHVADCSPPLMVLGEVPSFFKGDNNNGSKMSIITESSFCDDIYGVAKATLNFAMDVRHPLQQFTLCDRCGLMGNTGVQLLENREHGRVKLNI